MTVARGVWPGELSPGDGVKFHVVDASGSKQSSTWRIGTSKNRDDVYLMELETGPLWKVSHHNEGGVWRIAMTNDGARRLALERQVIDHWHPHAPADGWSEGVGVLISGKHLTPPKIPERKAVVAVPAPPPGHDALLVRLFFSEPGAAPGAFGRGYPIGVLRRSSGGLAYVLAQPQKLSARALDELERMRADAADAAPEGGYPDGRFVAVYSQGDGRFLADLCL